MEEQFLCLAPAAKIMILCHHPRPVCACALQDHASCFAKVALFAQQRNQRKGVALKSSAVHSYRQCLSSVNTRGCLLGKAAPALKGGLLLIYLSSPLLVGVIFPLAGAVVNNRFASHEFAHAPVVYRVGVNTRQPPQAIADRGVESAHRRWSSALQTSACFFLFCPEVSFSR